VRADTAITKMINRGVGPSSFPKGQRAEGVSAMGPYRATMSHGTTSTPRLDTDYTGALIPSPRDQDQRIWPGLHWASHQQAYMQLFWA